MMEAVHRYEGTVNQVMGDGIMALFGAPLAHEDHAVRACYAALRMQESVKKYAEEVRRPLLPPLLALLDVPVEDAAWQHLDPPARRTRQPETTR
jgi:class 3 adenylate cyclase